MTSLSILRLVAKPGKIEAGEVLFDGRDLLTLGGDDMRKVRGEQIAMIFQQPTSSLNPVWDVGRQIGEVLEIHRSMKRKVARTGPSTAKRSGIRIRAAPALLPRTTLSVNGPAGMIAMALACEPTCHRGRADERPST